MKLRIVAARALVTMNHRKTLGRFMAVDAKLLEILCCPVSKVPLTRLERARLEKLNEAIARKGVVTVRGVAIDQPLKEALITQDGRVIYPVVDDIPILLEDRGIGTTQFQDF